MGFIVGPRGFLKRGEFLVIAARRFAVIGVEHQFAAGVVGIGIVWKSAIDDDNGVDAAVAPVGEDFVGFASDGGVSAVWDPLAFVTFTEYVKQIIYKKCLFFLKLNT